MKTSSGGLDGLDETLLGNNNSEDYDVDDNRHSHSDDDDPRRKERLHWTFLFSNLIAQWRKDSEFCGKGWKFPLMVLVWSIKMLLNNCGGWLFLIGNFHLLNLSCGRRWVGRVLILQQTLGVEDLYHWRISSFSARFIRKAKYLGWNSVFGTTEGRRNGI